MSQGASKAQGTVSWFRNESDHGFVCPDDGDQEVHVRQEHILGDGDELLKKGYRVTYDVCEDAKGLWARNVSRAQQHRYSWRDDCLERLEGKEARHEYYSQLGESEGVIKNLSKRWLSDTNHPAFARYHKTLIGLQVLEREAQEVRHRVQAKRKLIS